MAFLFISLTAEVISALAPLLFSQLLQVDSAYWLGGSDPQIKSKFYEVNPHLASVYCTSLISLGSLLSSLYQTVSYSLSHLHDFIHVLPSVYNSLPHPVYRENLMNLFLSSQITILSISSLLNKELLEGKTMFPSLGHRRILIILDK